jgi:DNA ligase 1
MNLVNDTVLVTRNARDKIQVSRFVLQQDKNNYIIERFTGQYGGKMTQQPTKVIERGKVKRSVLMQAELEFNSLIKKSLDKGYKKLSDLTKISFDIITDSELDELVPSIKTDAQGNIKPQLAKSSNDCTINIFDKPSFCSRKIDGVRCLMKWDSNKEEIITISRGGKDYDASTTHLREIELLKTYLKDNPKTILDGELYVHGWPLQKISGTCRLKTWEERCEPIEYWIFDIVDTEMNFNERLDILTDLEIYLKDEPKIKIVEHIYLEGWASVKKHHDKFIQEGFEGLVSRKINKVYQPGKRNSDWVKLKDYKDAEFEIIGISEKSRPEDFCFRLITDEGKEFSAKPVGSRELREEYLENWEDYVGKMATVKFFNWTTDKIPSQPIFKNIREEDE